MSVIFQKHKCWIMYYVCGSIANTVKFSLCVAPRRPSASFLVKFKEDIFIPPLKYIENQSYLNLIFIG